MGNYRTAEKLEAMLEKSGIPIIPALVFSGRKMQEMDGQFFYLYEWYDGKTLKKEEITEFHCRKIAGFLARINALGRRLVMMGYILTGNFIWNNIRKRTGNFILC